MVSHGVYELCAFGEDSENIFQTLISGSFVSYLKV